MDHSIFEPTCAHARWALMHRFLSVKEIHLIEIHQTLIHILGNTAPRVMKCGRCINVDELEFDLEGQGHRSKVKVTRSKNYTMFGVQSHMGQCQRSRGSRSKVTWVQVCLKVIILAGGLMSTSSCIFYPYLPYGRSSCLKRKMSWFDMWY